MNQGWKFPVNRQQSPPLLITTREQAETQRSVGT